MNKIEKDYLLIKKDNGLKYVADAYNPASKTEVLIFCYAYNHEMYISQCIDSMLNQKVDFNVKIIIHNDNSNDSTLKIINEYSQKFPNIIKVVSQNKNLYDPAHGLLPIFCYLRKYHDGTFVAICEGDDYWIDPYKLAFQTKIMKKFPKLSFCVHKVNVMNDSTKEIERTIPAKKFKVRSGIISSDRFIELASIRYPFQTSSYFFRTSDFSNYLDNLPEFAKIMPTEDESLLLYFGQLGNVAYLDHPMSIYRKFSEGSWSNDHKDPNKVHQGNNRLMKMVDAVKEFDNYTNYRFHCSCNKRIVKHEFRILMNNNKIDNIFKDRQLKRYFKLTYPKDYWSYRIKAFLKRR